MIRRYVIPGCGVVALVCLLAACSGGSADSTTTAADAHTVTVTVAVPQRQTFHDSIEAIGTTMGDPHRARTLSLAYGGQIAGVTAIAGQSVKGGQPLLTITADPATRQAYQQTQAALSLARGELARTEQLAAQRLATQSQVAAARKSLADAQAALGAQQAIGGSRDSDTVTAPSDGVVTALRVVLGDRVAANAPLLDFTPAHALIAQLGVQPELGDKLRAGMPVQIHSVYGPSDGFTGTLRMIGQSIDPQSHLLPAQVELPASAGSRLLAGAAVIAQIEASDFSAWAVPRNAVLHDDQGSYVFQVHDGHAKRVDVTVRSPDGDTVGVSGSIDAQAPIVVLGVYELGDGDAVKVGTAKAQPLPTTTAPASAGSTR